MNNIRRKLLIITTYFPPVQSVASQRIISFVKYLSPEKYDIKVIAWSDEPAVAPELAGVSYQVVYLPNPTLLKRAKFTKASSALVHKFKALYNVVLALAGINEMSGWGKLADKEVSRILVDWKPDLMLATYPSAEALQVGIRNARNFGIPFVADLRDGITNNSSHGFFVRKRLQSLETQVMHASRAILTVSKPLVEYLKLRYPTIDKQIFELRNGFDFVPGNTGTFNDVFTICYAGTFYGDRKPAHFFEAVLSLIKQGRIKNIRLQFPGVLKNFHIPEALEKYCEFLPKMPYNQVIQIIRNADALLLVLDKSEYKGAYSAKIFDYLGAMRPVIAIVDREDVAARLIRDCRAGFVAEWNDVHEISEAITGALKLWEEKKLPDFDRVIIEAHHRRVLAQRLENILDELSEKHV